MGVPFKKIPRQDPRKADAATKYYPQLVTLGTRPVHPLTAILLRACLNFVQPSFESSF